MTARILDNDVTSILDHRAKHLAGRVNDLLSAGGTPMCRRRTA